MSMPITSAVFLASPMTRLGSPAAIAAPPTPRSFATSRRLIQSCLSIIVLPDVVVFCRCAARPRRDWSYQITASSRPSAAILELRRERLGAAREEADIGADGDKERAEREPAARRLLAVGQDAGGLAVLDDARDRIVDPRHHLGVGALAGKAERGVEGGRADEHAVDGRARRQGRATRAGRPTRRTRRRCPRPPRSPRGSTGPRRIRSAPRRRSRPPP